MEHKQERAAKNKKCFAVMIKGKINRFRTAKEMYSFAEYKNNIHEWRGFYEFKAYKMPNGHPNWGEWHSLGVLPPVDMLNDYINYLI